MAGTATQDLSLLHIFINTAPQEELSLATMPPHAVQLPNTSSVCVTSVYPIRLAIRSKPSATQKSNVSTRPHRRQTT
jgi:hypothetical protein